MTNSKCILQQITHCAPRSIVELRALGGDDGTWKVWLMLLATTTTTLQQLSANNGEIGIAQISVTGSLTALRSKHHFTS